MSRRYNLKARSCARLTAAAGLVTAALLACGNTGDGSGASGNELTTGQSTGPDVTQPVPTPTTPSSSGGPAAPSPPTNSHLPTTEPADPGPPMPSASSTPSTPSTSVAPSASVTNTPADPSGSGGTGPSDGSGGAPNAGNAGGEQGLGGAGAGGETPSAGGNGGAGGSGGSSNAPACPPATPLSGGQQYCSNSRGDAGNGYGYELWAEGGGTGCMTVHRQGGAFSAEWDGVEDFLARVGLDFDQTRTHSQIGTIYAEFAETKSGSEEGLTYIGIYGWTVEPLREFYILDDWGTEKPAGFSSDGTPRDEVGTIEVDGEIYDVWKKTRENKPSIIGDATFDQYFSIRRTARQCGRISVSEHFEKWEEFGLPLGNLYEVKLLLEAQFNSGSVAFSQASVVVE